MYESFFSYPVERHYPYRWFTPTVIVGGIVVAALISFINVIATGYVLVATSSNNPNETVANPRWYGSVNWPSSFTSNAHAACAASTFNVNSEISTNNSAFSYTLQNVWRTRDDGTRVNLGSLVYLNNPLRNCDVTKVNIQVLSTYTQTYEQSARSKAGLLIEAYASCSIDADTSLTDDVNGPTYFDLKATYDLVKGNMGFRSRNQTTQASLFWGESLLQMYWLVLARNYKLAAIGIVPEDLYGASIILTRNSNATVGTVAEVESLDFFRISCFTEKAGWCQSSSVPLLMQRGRNPYPPIWKSVDVLGKAMWFSVLTDLGRQKSAVPNMLVQPTLLANLTSNYTSEIQAWPTYNAYITQPLDRGLAQASFDPNAKPLPNLNATQSTLTSSYVCQVPRLKSAGPLFYTVLLADLVYLQNAFKLFVFVVGYLLHRRRPDANYCDGCRGVVVQGAQQSNDQHIPLTGEGRAALDDQDLCLSSTQNDSDEPKEGYERINQHELRSP